MGINVLVISNYNNYHAVRPDAEIFIGLTSLGFNVHVMTFQEAQYIPNFEAAGVRVIPYHPEKKFDKKAVQKIRSYILEHNIHILHLGNSRSIINGIRAARGLSVKVVLYRGHTGDVHWYDPTAYLKFLHPRVDAIVCNSSSVKEFLDKQWFFDASKTHVITKGHDVSWYKDITPVDRSAVGVPEHAILISCVANNRKVKGITYLLEAMRLLPPDLPIHLVLVGRNMDAEENLAIIDQMVHKERVHVLGFRKDALRIVAASDIFVLTSIGGESLTKAVVEAMILGKAPVITDIGGHKELVVHEKNGLLFPPKDPQALADALLHLYHHPTLIEQYGMAARKHVEEKLSHGETVRKYKALYEGLVRGSREEVSAE